MGRGSQNFTFPAEAGKFISEGTVVEERKNDIAIVNLKVAPAVGSPSYSLGGLAGVGTSVTIISNKGSLGNVTVGALPESLTIEVPEGPAFRVVPDRTRTISGNQVCVGHSGSPAIQNGMVVGIVVAADRFRCGNKPTLIAL